MREGPANARLDSLEKEVEYLTAAVESLRDESRFVRSLVEGPETDALPPPPEGAAEQAPDPEA